MEINTAGIDLSNYTYKRSGRPSKSLENAIAKEVYDLNLKLGEFFDFQKVENFNTGLFHSAIKTLNNKNGTSYKFTFFDSPEDKTRYRLIRIV